MRLTKHLAKYITIFSLAFSFLSCSGDSDDSSNNETSQPSTANCTLDNINFTKYAELVSGSTISEAEEVIGCKHEVQSTENGITTAHWILDDAPNVYIAGDFSDDTGLGSQSIIGINSDTGRPYCSAAPDYPNCFEDG